MDNDDPRVTNPERHYLRKEIEAIEPFDIAWTREPWYKKSLIVSKRFYELCRDAQFKMTWIPVRIDIV